MTFHPSAPFDAQAASFDLRAGLPHATAVAVGVAVAREWRGAGTVLEVGAGTGQIGVEICKRVASYVALDESEKMLTLLRSRLAEAGLSGRVVQANARAAWPLPTQSLCVAFGSRFWHWLDPDHAIDQVRRLAGPSGCTLLVGRVQRDPVSHKELLRRELLDLLRRHGAARAQPSRVRMLERAVERGGMPIPMRSVATWTRWAAPRDSLDAWRSKRRLAGMDVPNHTARRVLSELESWTLERFGNIDTPLPVQETYTLEGARFSDHEE